MNRKLGGAGALVLGAAAAVIYSQWGGAQRDVVVLKPHPEVFGVPSAMAVLTEREPISRAPVAATMQATPNAAAVESKQATFDRLVKTGKPEDAFAAYRLLLSCKLDDVCGDLTAGQKTMAYNLLKQAVAAHVPKASIFLLITTPDGREPYEVHGDPAYETWKADAMREITEAAARGDAGALRQMAQLSMKDDKPEQALTYWTAFTDRSPAASRQQMFEAAASQLSKGLSPEKVAVAIAQGHAMGGAK